jgi:hypothetical protein
LEKSFTRSWLLRQSLPCFICLAKSYPKHQNQKTMKHLTLKTTKRVEGTTVVPEYFRINHSQYYKIVSEKTYVVVSFYGTTKQEMEALTIYPEIQVKMVEHLYIYIQDQNIVEITKEQFTEQFDACMTFIDSL